MKLLDQERNALQAQKAEQARTEEKRMARQAAAIADVKAWLDELVQESKVPIKVKDANHRGWWVHIGRRPDVATIVVHVTRPDAAPWYEFGDPQSGGNSKDTPWAEIQQRLCKHIAATEWEQVEAIGNQLTATPAVNP